MKFVLASYGAVSRELGLCRDTVNAIAIDATQTIVAADNDCLDGARAVGLDEYRWSHTRGGNEFVTVVVDLTGVRLRPLLWRPSAC